MEDKEKENIIPVDQPVISIGTVARLLNVSVQLLRKYEQEGLIIPYKTISNQRLYSQRDLARLTCIRELIKKRGLNIRGIKNLMSLVPCWEIVKCSEDKRKNCPAYFSNEEPCWTLRREGQICHVEDCRECEVYRSVDQIKNMKNFLRRTHIIE